MKIRTSTLALIAIFGALYFTWHNRGGLIEVGKSAANTHAELLKDCS